MLEFAVYGATVQCGSGSCTTVFTPPNRGITAGHSWVGIESDSSSTCFAGDFGLCKFTQKQCTKSFVSKWFNPCTGVLYPTGVLKRLDTSKNIPAEYLLTIESCLVCTRGDKIVFVSDGQKK